MHGHVVSLKGANDDAMSVSPQWDAPVRVVLEMRALTELHLSGSQRDRCDILSCFLTTNLSITQYHWSGGLSSSLQGMWVAGLTIPISKYGNGSTSEFWIFHQCTELCCDKWPIYRGNYTQASFIMLITLIDRYIYILHLRSQPHHLYLPWNIQVLCSQAVMNTYRGLETISSLVLMIKENHSFYMV